jgi:hypothetical protein
MLAQMDQPRTSACSIPSNDMLGACLLAGHAPGLKSCSSPVAAAAWH